MLYSAPLNTLYKKILENPVLVRVVPLTVLIILTSLQVMTGVQGPFYLYSLKIVLGAFFIFAIRPYVPEMRWAFGWEALVVGVGVFVVWVWLDPFYPKLGKGGVDWNPHEVFGQGSILAWAFLAIRIMGMTLVVPPLEEIVYRSFLYRYIAKPDFEKFPMEQFSLAGLLGSAVIFGFCHSQWLAGIICGLAYQWLVLRRKRLGDAITAHAITNFLLGCYVAYKGAWQFF